MLVNYQDKKFITLAPGALYYKILQIRTVQKMGKLCSVLVLLTVSVNVGKMENWQNGKMAKW